MRLASAGPAAGADVGLDVEREREADEREAQPWFEDGRKRCCGEERERQERAAPGDPAGVLGDLIGSLQYVALHQVVGAVRAHEQSAVDSFMAAIEAR